MLMLEVEETVKWVRRYLRKNKDSRDTSKATEKQYDSFANMVQHYGDYNEKSKKTQKKKAIKRVVKAMNR